MSETPSTGSFSVSTTNPQGNDITIRPYRPDEFESVVDMYQSFYDTGPGGQTIQKQGLPPKSGPDIREWLRDVIDEPNILAWDDDAVVGHVLLVPDEDSCHELGVFVHPRIRNQMFKSELVEAGLKYAEAKGIENIWLQTRPDDIGSQEIYEQFGLSRDKIDEPIEIIWMSGEV